VICKDLQSFPMLTSHNRTKAGFGGGGKTGVGECSPINLNPRDLGKGVQPWRIDTQLLSDGIKELVDINLGREEKENGASG